VENARYLHSSIEAIKRVKSGPDADALLDLESVLRQRILYYSDEQVVVDESASWCITLLDDADKLQKLSASAQGRLKYAVSAILLGTVATFRCLELSLDQLKRGSILDMVFTAGRSGTTEAASGFTRWYLIGGLLCPHGLVTICYTVNNSEMTTKLLGVGGANVFEFNELYNFDLYHER
jgi:hypothetical protein